MKSARSFILLAVLITASNSFAQSLPSSAINSRFQRPVFLLLPRATAQVLHADSLSPCQALLNKGESYEITSQWQMGVDTLTKVIETCTTFVDAWQAFSNLQSDFYSVGHDSIDWVNFRAWLVSVLYINKASPEYFCQDVITLANSYFDPNQTIAIVRWLEQNTTCDPHILIQMDTGLRGYQTRQWEKGNKNVPIDTALPSMHDLGLDSVLAIHFASVTVPGKPFATIVPAYCVTENPLDNQTTLHFTLSEASFAKVDVLDVLGREVAVVGTGRILDPGEHQLPVDLSGSTAGTYYLRISLGTGEVRTIKLVKK